MKDYKKKYEEALGRARTFNQRWQGIEATDSELALQELKEIFPELKESKDKRIKTNIIKILRFVRDTHHQYSDECNESINWLEKQGEQKSQGKSALEVWKDMRLEVYQQASGNRHEPNYSDDSTKMFSLTDIDEIFEKVGEKQGEQNKQYLYDIIIALWNLLDKIDTFSDLQIDDTNSDNPFRKIEHITQERYKFVKSDGYNLYIKGEQITDFKQGEQNINKLKPKFKVGDWVVNKETGITYQVKEIVKLNCGYAYNLTNGGYISSFKSDDYRLWTIQDAKDGEILAAGDTVVIFKDLYNATTFHSYCHIENGVFNISKDDMPDWWRCEGFNPANIEQGELLFSNMNKAGYVWDFENKELKQIKQNTAWNEKYIADIFEKVGLAKIVREKGSDELTNAVQDAMIELNKFISQQNIAWSEDDERIYRCLINDQKEGFDKVNNSKSGHTEIISDLKEMYRERINWLEVIKRKMKGE